MKYDLFATPVWVEQFNDAEKLNKQLLDIGKIFQFGDEYFDLPGKAIQTLKTWVLSCADAISKEYRWYDSPKIIHGRQNPIAPNQCDTPHWHPHAKLIAIYYLQVQENQGDILLMDPRGATWWPDPKVETNEYRLGRMYHRINPKPGMLVMFPNYLVHSVETNLSDSYRISITMEIFDPPKDTFTYH